VLISAAGIVVLFDLGGLGRRLIALQSRNVKFSWQRKVSADNVFAVRPTESRIVFGVGMTLIGSAWLGGGLYSLLR
jgi:hypothetical protein